MKPRVLITAVGKDAVIATEKTNAVLDRLMGQGKKIMGVAPMGMNVMISYMDAVPQPMPSQEEVAKSKMPDGSKRYVTPEELKEIKEKQEKALKEIPQNDTMKDVGTKSLPAPKAKKKKRGKNNG